MTLGLSDFVIFVIGLILGIILGAVFFADDASAAALVEAGRGWCRTCRPL